MKTAQELAEEYVQREHEILSARGRLFCGEDVTDAFLAGYEAAKRERGDKVPGKIAMSEQLQQVVFGHFGEALLVAFEFGSSLFRFSTAERRHFRVEITEFTDSDKGETP